MIITPLAHDGRQQAEKQSDSIVIPERRRDKRTEIDCPASLYLLSEDSGPLPTQIVDVSVSGMEIETNSPLKPGALVRMNVPGSLILGEVVWCNGEGLHYSAGIRIEHSLVNLTQIPT
jgi:hypothetical protein